MTKYARIINSIAVDVSSKDPNSLFHPLIAKDFITVPDNVLPGASLKDGVWTNPEIKPIEVREEVKPDIKLSFLDFKLLFTSQERIAIKSARQTDPILDDFYDIVENPEYKLINLSSQSTKDVLTHMVTLNLLTEERLSVIITGKPV